MNNKNAVKSLPEIAYKNFSIKMHEAKVLSSIPIKGHMELTFGCNLKCVHCYTCCFNKKEYIQKELSFYEIKKILDQISDEGCLWLAFTGGEPLLRKDFLDIYMYAKKKGFLITIMTNGTLITSELADKLMRYPPFSIEITLHGITKKTYESVTRVKGSFEKCMENVHRILKGNLPLKLKTHITSLNYHEMERIENFINNIGLSVNFDPVIYPRLDGSLVPYQYRVSIGQMAKLAYEDSLTFFGKDNKKKGGDADKYAITCANGINSFFIDPYGRVVFCNLIRNPSFSLKDSSFKKCFNELYPFFRNLKYKTESKCRYCDFIESCKRCAGIAKLECKNFESPIDYFCQVFNYEHTKKLQPVGI